MPVRLILDITNSTIDLANPGVVRVARRFSRELQNTGSPLFVIWDPVGNRYVLPAPEEHQRLSRFNGPEADPARLSPGAWERISLDQVLERNGTDRPCLILPETLGALRCRLMRPYARRLGLALAAIFHDAIPVIHPELVNRAIRLDHRDYMIGLAACDFVMPVSQFSGDCLQTFWRQEGIAGPPVHVNWLPGEFAGTGRTIPGPGPERPVSILCVSTLEPRKNHVGLIDACLPLCETRPDLDWSLTLVGDRYSGAPLLVEYIQRAAELSSRIRWLGVVEDETLGRLYAESSFTVYPSALEGFGMPILESLWHARPCLCADQGVMAELAADGGCLAVNVEDTSELSAGIERLIEDRDLRGRLSEQAAARKLKRWEDYVSDFYGILQKQGLGVT